MQDALNLYSTYGAPAIPQNFNIYNKLCADVFAMPDISGAEGYSVWSQLRQILNEIVSVNKLTFYRSIIEVVINLSFRYLKNKYLSSLK